MLCSDGVYNDLGNDALINALADTASTADEIFYKIESDPLIYSDLSTIGGHVTWAAIEG